MRESAAAALAQQMSLLPSHRAFRRQTGRLRVRQMPSCVYNIFCKRVQGQSNALPRALAPPCSCCYQLMIRLASSSYTGMRWQLTFSQGPASDNPSASGSPHGWMRAGARCRSL
jgi:hypothetical protein